MTRPIRISCRFAGVAAATLLGAAAARGAVLETAEAALARRWPGAQIERERLLLTAAEQESVARQTGLDPPSALTVRYVVRGDDGVNGYAYLDKHRVRTLPEVLLVVLDALGEVTAVEVLAFAEPPDYQASERWLDQLTGRSAADPPVLDHNVQGITGATLTARAATDAVRRIFAVHRVLSESEAVEP